MEDHDEPFTVAWADEDQPMILLGTLRGARRQATAHAELIRTTPQLRDEASHLLACLYDILQEG